jgi:hypothetical protein
MTAHNTPAFQVQPNPFDSANCSPTDPATPHFDVMIVAIADGSVHTVDPTVTPNTWNMACMPNDGGVLGSDW